MQIPKLYAAFIAAIVFSVIQTSAQVTGSGTTGTVPVWVGTTKLGNSVIVESGGNVGIGTKKPSAKFNAVTTNKTAAAITGNANATSGSAAGVVGTTASGTNYAAAISGLASAATGFTRGVQGLSSSPNGTGVLGSATSTSAGGSIGVEGSTSNGGTGVVGVASATTGLNFGVQGITPSSGGVGVQGSSPYIAVAGFNQVCSPTCNLVAGTAGQFVTGSGGIVLEGLAGSGYAGVFSVDSNGNLSITGKLSKGSGSFKIDHPLDPANKYLEHSFVESPDMMNIYNGIAMLDSRGKRQ